MVAFGVCAKWPNKPRADTLHHTTVHSSASLLRFACTSCIQWASRDWRSFTWIPQIDSHSFRCSRAHTHGVRLRPNIANGLRCLSSTKSRSVAYSHIKRERACSWRLKSRKKRKKNRIPTHTTNALNPVLCTRVIQAIKNTQKLAHIYVYIRMLKWCCCCCYVATTSAPNWQMKRKTWKKVFFFSPCFYNFKTRWRGQCLNIWIHSNFNFHLFM